MQQPAHYWLYPFATPQGELTEGAQYLEMIFSSFVFRVPKHTWFNVSLSTVDYFEI